MSYTNKNRAKINNIIRKLIFPNETKRFIVGDKIIFNNYYRTETTKFYASQISIIKNIEEQTVTFTPIPIDRLLNLNYSLTPKKLTKVISRQGGLHQNENQMSEMSKFR